ncbi:MAG: FG-GAP repeat protein, partial [Spirochaetaceae bacterium]|nr:FG-GAP repeat protein [Spirochaetaceae bacterium]
DRFGGSIAMDGSLAVIGSEPGGVVKPGSAYVYRNNGGTWVQEAKLLPETSVPGEEDLFGGSVSISGRYAVIGAAKGDGLVADSGTASVFFRNDDGSWIRTDTLQADDGQANDSFGLAVAVSGYTVLVGAPEEDGAGNLEPDAGKFYFFN